MNTNRNEIANQDVVDAFNNAAHALAHMLAPEFHLRPFDGKFPARFAALTPSRQGEILLSLRNYSELTSQVIAAGHALGNDRMVLWRVISALRLKPADDLFENIVDGDLIEIYDEHNIQIFRNFQFFRVCSYTLDDLLCRPWWELFRRDETIVRQIMKSAEHIYARNLRRSVHLDFGQYTLEEIDSPRRYKSIVENKLLSPLVDSSGKVSAIVNIIKVYSCLPGEFPETFLGEKELASEIPRQRY